MFDLKPIAKDSIPRALARAERYRLLNEPREAESICRDILAIDPANQDALVCMILATTDMFHGLRVAILEARLLLPGLKAEFDRHYYTGVVEERWGKALQEAGYPKEAVYQFLREAMTHFEAAQAAAPHGNDDAILRWNACVRIIERHGLAPADEEETTEESFDDDMPVR